MGACSAFKCRNDSSKRVPGVSFHKFPKNEKLRAKWVKATRRKNWTPSKHSYLCSKHFTEEMIDRTSLCCVRLRENAVPTIFEVFPSYLQNGWYYQKRRSKHASVIPDHTYLEDRDSSSDDSLVNVSDCSASPDEESEQSLSQTSSILNNSFVSQTSPNDNSPVEISNNCPVIGDSSKTLPVVSTPTILNQVPTNNSIMHISLISLPCSSLLCQRAAQMKEEQFKVMLQEAIQCRKNYRRKIKTLQQKGRRYKKKIERLKSYFSYIRKKN